MGKSQPPSPKAAPPPPDPNKDEQAKASAGLAASNEKRRSLASSAEGTFGLTQDALGGAPTKSPDLKNTLG